MKLFSACRCCRSCRCLSSRSVAVIPLACRHTPPLASPLTPSSGDAPLPLLTPGTFSEPGEPAAGVPNEEAESLRESSPTFLSAEEPESRPESLGAEFANAATVGTGTGTGALATATELFENDSASWSSDSLNAARPAVNEPSKLVSHLVSAFEANCAASPQRETCSLPSEDEEDSAAAYSASSALPVAAEVRHMHTDSLLGLPSFYCEDEQVHARALFLWLDVLVAVLAELDASIEDEEFLKVFLLLRLMAIDLSTLAAEAQLDKTPAVAQILSKQHKYFRNIFVESESRSVPLFALLCSSLNLRVRGSPVAWIRDGLAGAFSDAERLQLSSTLLGLVQHFGSKAIDVFLTKWRYFSKCLFDFRFDDRIVVDVPVLRLVSHAILQRWCDGLGSTYREPFRCANEQSPSVLLELPTRQIRALRSTDTADVAGAAKRNALTLRRSCSLALKESGSKPRCHSFWLRNHRHSRNNLHGRSRLGSRAHGDGVWAFDNKRGVCLAYKLNSDGFVDVRLRSRFAVRFINLLIMLDNHDRYHEWLPYCEKTTLLKALTRTSRIMSYVSSMPWPIGKHEAIVYCSATDLLKELGDMYLTLGVVQPNSVSDFTLPKAAKNVSRLNVCDMIFAVRPLGPNLTALDMSMKVDLMVKSRIVRSILPQMIRNTTFNFIQSIVKLANKISLETSLDRPNYDYYTTVERTVCELYGKYANEPLEEVEAVKAFDPAMPVADWHRHCLTYR